MNRRGFLSGVAGFLAAPAIVRASNIMPVSALPIEARAVLPLPYKGLVCDYLTSDYAWFLFGKEAAADRGAWLAQREAALDLFSAEPEVWRAS